MKNELTILWLSVSLSVSVSTVMSYILAVKTRQPKHETSSPANSSYSSNQASNLQGCGGLWKFSTLWVLTFIIIHQSKPYQSVAES